jgi:UrcA family protein
MNAILCRAICSLSLVAALSASPGRSGAATPERTVGEPTSLPVRFADLNTATPEGVKALYGRIQSAARQVCGPSFSLWQSDAFWAWRSCYRKTVDEAVSKLDFPALTALHRSVMPAAASTSSLQAGNR